jgi:hypothetical protein
MGQLTYANDYVQLPADSTGKRTGFLKWDTGGGNLLYLATSIPIDETGNTLVSALSADAVSGAVNAVRDAAFQFLYNGSTWDRVRGDTTNGMDVDVTRLSLFANRTTSATIGSATSLAISSEGVGSVSFDIAAGLANGTIFQFEATIDDTNWFSVPVVLQNGTMPAANVTALALGLPARGTFLGTGWSQVRVRVSSFVSGSSVVSLEASGTGIGMARGTVGVVRDDDPDVGVYPVKVGGVYRIAPATHTNGDMAEFLTDSKGQQRVVIYGDGVNTAVTSAVPADARVNANVFGTDINAILSVYNGTTIDRARGDTTNGLDVDVTRVGGTVLTKNTAGGTGTRSSVSVATTDTLLLAANANRIRASIYNDSSQILLVGDGTTAVSATSFTDKVYPGETYRVDDHTSQIRGIWLAADAAGAARVTEIT